MKKKTKVWLHIAENDLEFAQSILKNNQRPYYAVHFCHQALEKILKAIIQEITNENPKRTHNFKTLWEQSQIPLTETQKLQLLTLMPHYIGTKYAEDIQSLHEKYTVDFVKEMFNQTEEIFLWLKSFLMSKESLDPT